VKTVYWSPLSGQSGTTSNIMATSIMSILKLKKKVLLINAQHDKHSMENALIGSGSLEMLEDIGIDVLLRNMKINQVNADTIKNASISFFGEQLDYLPGTTKEKNQFKKDMCQLFIRILDIANSLYDYVFIDIGSGMNEINKKIIDAADLVVVNLPQSRVPIESFIREENPLGINKDKFIYLIGNYNCNSRYNIKNLVRSFHDFKGKIVAIPYNVEYLDAISDSEVIRFMQKNNIISHGKNKTFIKEVEKAVKLIEKKKGGSEVCRSPQT